MSNQIEELDELKGLSDKEKELALKILLDYQNSGESKILEELKNQDFKEQPVDIITFIKDRQYLGDAWHAPGGKCKLFPYWEEKLKELFPDNVTTSVNTFILSGARGLGKSEIAVTCCLYMMHRLMCLRNPYEYLNLKPTEKIAFSFMNITESLAKDIGVTKFQNTVQCSPWFMARGTLSGRRAVIWNPPDFINIIIGSQPGHVIGQATYCCLEGTTKIVTSEGVFQIKDLVNKEIVVPSMDSDRSIVLSDKCTVKPTSVTNDYIEIEFEDGTLIKCTPEHRFMLKNGGYKEAQYLTTEDEIQEVEPFGYIYKFTDLTTNKIYIGKREKPYFDFAYWGSGKVWSQILASVGRENIKREILCFANSRKELRELEIHYISQYNSTDPSVGYNIHKGGAGGNSLNNTQKWSELHRGERNGRYGMPVSEETREKISIANTGRRYSDEINKKKGRPGGPKPPGFGDKISKAQKGRVRSELELEHVKEGSRKTAEKNRGKITYNNGFNEIRILPTETPPEGFVRGGSPKRRQRMKELYESTDNFKGRHWFTDGETEVYAKTCPEGFIPGRVKKCK